MSKSWAEMTDQERWDHSQRWDTDWHRNNPNPSGDVLDFVNQQAGNITVTQPSEYLQAMAGDDVVENRLYTSSPALDPKSNYSETQTAAQNIQNSGFTGIEGDYYYNTGNPSLNQALYGNDIYQNMSYNNQGWEIPRNLQDNQATDVIDSLAMAMITSGLGAGGLFGSLQSLGNAQSAAQIANAASDVIVNLSDMYNDVTEDDPEGPPDIAWQLPDVSDQLGDFQVQIPDFSLPNEGGGGEPAGGGANSNSQIEDPSSEPSTQPELEEEEGLTTGGPLDSGFDMPQEVDNESQSGMEFVFHNGRWGVYGANGEFFPVENQERFPPNPQEGDTTYEHGDAGQEQEDDWTPSITVTYGNDGQLSTGAPPYWGTGIYGENATIGNSTGPAYNGMGPDGTQAGAGTGTGAGGGSGSGNGDGDGDGDGDGNESGSGGGAGGGAGRVSDAEWGELFPYTKLTPAQKTALLPHIDYIRSIRG